MNVAEFVSKWKKVALTERSAAQQHFLDLCAVFGHPTPASADAAGEWFAFEKGVDKQGGGKGFADVWKRGYFAFEYKGKHKDLDAAYSQLLKYRESLENPPMLVVCDMDRIVVRTNFTGTATIRHEIPLAEMETPESLRLLRALFFEPDRLKPGVTRAAITEEAARRLAEIAQSLRARGLEAHAVARFLDRIVFCLFAEDIGLLPRDLFSRLVEKTRSNAAHFTKLISELFATMAHGGDFGLDTIRWFNGNLFDGAPTLDLTLLEIEAVRQASVLDWSAVDPSILGTLFERGLDPEKRSQLGAHYTSRDDIETLIEPVIMQPLRQEWAAVQAEAKKAIERGTRQGRDTADRKLHEFLSRLGRVSVLDPACGSGNFLYIAMQKLKDLEKEVIDFALSLDFSAFLPEVGPWQLYGLEINPYAHDLAQMTVWIGYLQWLREHGYLITDNPVLRSTDNIRCMDAVLDEATWTEPDWPDSEFIVGNPPFLGGNRVRQELGDGYIDRLFAVYDGRVPAFADLCCYWFEKARKQIAEGRCRRAGLLATQGIRGGANRKVLERIKESGGIFFAESDRPWVLEGANVHVSMVGFDDGTDPARTVDGASASQINSDLTSAVDVTRAKSLSANLGICFMGPSPKASFDIDEAVALDMVRAPRNVNGRPNSDVIRPVASAIDLVQKARHKWTVDFGMMPINQASEYEAPFEYVKVHVYPVRSQGKRLVYGQNWWQYGRPRPALRTATEHLNRMIVTPAVAKHRLFTWVDPAVLCNQGTLVYAYSDDYHFGLLQSRIHEIWALILGTRLETRPRYTPTTCFETFPLPEPTPEQTAAIVDAAHELSEKRNRWLNPPEWMCEEILEFPGAVDGPWGRYVTEPDASGIGTVRYPRLVPRMATNAKDVAARTLTNLYNQRSAWLDMAHKRLDAAVCTAYGFDPAISDDEILACLLALNLCNAGAS